LQKVWRLRSANGWLSGGQHGEDLLEVAHGELHAIVEHGDGWFGPDVGHLRSGGTAWAGRWCGLRPRNAAAGKKEHI